MVVKAILDKENIILTNMLYFKQIMLTKAQNEESIKSAYEATCLAKGI